jgi:hypothetical protein
MLLVHGIPLDIRGLFHRVASQPGMLHALGLMLLAWGIGIAGKILFFAWDFWYKRPFMQPSCAPSTRPALEPRLSI